MDRQEDPQSEDARDKRIRALEAGLACEGLGLRMVILAGLAAEAAAKGISASKWRKDLEGHLVYIAALCEVLPNAAADLRAVGLWPWPDPSNNPSQG